MDYEGLRFMNQDAAVSWHHRNSFVLKTLCQPTDMVQWRMWRVQFNSLENIMETVFWIVLICGVLRIYLDVTK